MSNKSFCFVVLAYNHKHYILEHLESIKYQVVNFGSNIPIQLIVNDDASQDDTTKLIESWLEDNGSFFSRIDLIFNDVNLGTCQSLCNCLKLLQSDYCKLTAGDDVYSCENIFDLMAYSDESDIVTAVPIRLINNKLGFSKTEVAFTLGMDQVYDNLLEIVESINFINAPNALYHSKYLKNPRLIDFLSNYDVVEDWPLQIFTSICNPNAKIKVVDKCYVYYRRTAGSTYLVASARLRRDMYKIFDYLLSAEIGVWRKLKLRNRRFCFGLSSKLLKKTLNLSVIIFVTKNLLNWIAINKRVRTFISIDSFKIYQEHYCSIVNATDQYSVVEDGK